MFKRITIAVLLTALVPGTVHAQEQPDHRIAPGEEPEVRVIEQPDKTIEEYSVNGQVYMIKVDPDMGPSYYLIDRDGDGEWDNRRSDLEGDFVAPQWIIFQW